MSAFKTIALIGRYNSAEVATALATMGDYLRNQGGDGSMLNAARHLAAHRVPLVGVNQGRLGFMTDIASANMIDAMAGILAGRHAIEERTMLAAEVRRDGAVTLATLALNDAVVNKGAVGRLIEFLVHIDGEFVYDLRADGLIVATPTGSTAYALSSDGPILQPSVPWFALVPICPHTLSNRPIMVSDRTVIDITLKRSNQPLLRSRAQRKVLDEHAGLVPLAKEESDAYREWQRLCRVRLDHESNALARNAEREQLAWQVEDLSRLALAPGEWDAIGSEHGRLAHA